MIELSRESNQETLTHLLEAWNAGDPDAAMAAMPLVYDELKRIARRYFSRERRGHTLQATAIVHEAYIRMVEDNGVRWQSRTHFIGTLAHMMRRILVDHARQRNADKRGGSAHSVTLVEAEAASAERSPDLVKLDETLDELSQVDPRKAKIVELRFFGGLTIEETADFLDTSPATVIRQWRRARAWLYGRLRNASPDCAALSPAT